jgi:glycosyltransferase involved in cell wall biosynthesis
VSRRRVVHLVEGLGVGGLERIVQTLVHHVDGRRFDLQVVCTARGGPLKETLEAAGARVTVLGLGGYYPGDLLRAARTLSSLGPDVVHTHGHVAGVIGRAAAWWAGVPAVVHHLHTLDTSLRARHLRLERVLARVTDRILCCSGAVERHAAERMRLPPPLLLTIPNGIDPAPVIRRQEAAALIGSPVGPVLGCLGALTRHKGQEILLRACALLEPETRPGTIVLLGEGPERARLETLAAIPELRGRVLFQGLRLDARRILPAFDLLVAPSREREGLGLAPLEAMDAGLPVVASRVGGLPEVVVDGETGYLVPPDDPAALSAAIHRVLRLPDRGRALGEAGRRRVERTFRAAPMSRRVEAVYEEALRERRAA